MSKILFRALIVLFSGSLFLASPDPAQTLKVGYTSKTIFFLPFFVAQKKAFYDAENLKVELIQMGAPAVSLQALIAGQIQISNINPDGIIIVNEKGANLKAIAGVVNGVAYTLVGGKRYKKLEDIRGTRLGVGSLKGGPTTFLLEYLRAKGFTIRATIVWRLSREARRHAWRHWKAEPYRQPSWAFLNRIWRSTAVSTGWATLLRRCRHFNSQP